MGAMSGSKRTMLIGMALLFGVAVVAYARVVSFDFAYDDHWTIVQNSRLDASLSEIVRALAAGEGPKRQIPDATRPAMVVSVWLDRQVWGSWPGGYHLHSLLLFGAVSVLAGAVAFAWERRKRAALVAGLFFALAPIHAEAVAAINYRENLLAAFGVLLPLGWLFWPRGARETAIQSALVGVAFGIGLLGKESAIAGLGLVVVAATILRMRVGWWRSRERTLVAMAAAAIVWANWRAALLIGGDDIPRAADQPLAARLLSTARFEVRAVSNSLVPWSWSPEYAREAPASWSWALALAGLVAITVLLARRRVTRLPALGIAVALIAPLPSSPLVGPVNPRADRYLFLAVLGGALLWGWAADHVARRIASPLRLPALALGTIPLALGVQVASAPWKNDRTLWSVAARRAPEAPRAWAGLSRAYRLAGDLDAADQAVQRAIDLDPNFVQARVTKVYARIARGDVAGARREIGRITELGGGPYRGLPRAIRCSKLPPAQARECIRPKWR